LSNFFFIGGNQRKHTIWNCQPQKTPAGAQIIPCRGKTGVAVTVSYLAPGRGYLIFCWLPFLVQLPYLGTVFSISPEKPWALREAK
jgi:hypothetical protein